jgi:hypothetical protein
MPFSTWARSTTNRNGDFPKSRSINSE